MFCWKGEREDRSSIVCDTGEPAGSVMVLAFFADLKSKGSTQRVLPSGFNNRKVL